MQVRGRGHTGLLPAWTTAVRRGTPVWPAAQSSCPPPEPSVVPASWRMTSFPPFVSRLKLTSLLQFYLSSPSLPLSIDVCIPNATPLSEIPSAFRLLPV